MTRKTDKRQNPGARSIRLQPRKRKAPRQKPAPFTRAGLIEAREKLQLAKDMHSALDKNAEVRAALIRRIERSIRGNLPVMVLHQIAQAIELWADAREED